MLANLITVLPSDLRVFVWSLLATYSAWYLICFYRLVARLPKGPTPLPILGNVFFLVKGRLLGGRNINYHLMELHNKYGTFYTLWMFNRPVIMIGDPDLVRKVFNQKSNNGRSAVILQKVLSDGQGEALLFQDDGPAWMCNRKIAHNALRKFIVSDQLPVFVNDSVSRVLDKILTTEGYDQPFDMSKYVSMIATNIASSSTFGKSYKLDDPELVEITHYFKLLGGQFDYLAWADGVPSFVRSMFIKTFAKDTIYGFTSLNKLCQKKIKEHQQDYEEGVIRDYADSLISAKNEAVDEGKESTAYLTDRNLGNVLTDLFFAGIDTSSYVLTWIFLFMTKYPEMQTRMRKEIKEFIGDRVPVQSDKDQCHFTVSFIAEALRMRDMPTFGVAHTTRAETTINDHLIPEGIMMSSYLFAIGNSDKFWPRAEVFDPIRFLDEDGHFSINDKSGFMAFGAGRRVCPGERLAWVDLFLILANVFRDTDGCVFEFDGDTDEASVELEPIQITMCQTKPFKIKLVKV